MERPGQSPDEAQRGDRMKMWDGRFAVETDTLMEKFNNSLPVDRKLVKEDISVNMAWAKALEKAGILSSDECSKIRACFESMLEEYAQGTLTFDAGDEDIHMAVERLLTERVGEIGARIHTGRSRNDQVVTDFRLYVMDALEEMHSLIEGLQRALLKRAQGDIETIIPGYTHLQQAQPILLSHYWLSFFWALEREKKRLTHARETADMMPLGSGALAGAGFCVDRDFLAKELGFSRVSENSLDAVASRDFVLEALSAFASLGILLSRYAEDLIVWSSREFGFVELDDAWSTGSSMMPQKKNPDSLELIRGKSARAIGNHARMASLLKGLGLTYFKDLQEDKDAFFDSHENAGMVLAVFARVVETVRVRTEDIERSLDPFLLATDLADYLVGRGMPFRQAHRVIGKIVAYCIQESLPLNKLTLPELEKFSDLFQEDVLEVFSWSDAISHRDIQGGTGKKSVERQIEDAGKLVG